MGEGSDISRRDSTLQLYRIGPLCISMMFYFFSLSLGQILSLEKPPEYSRETNFLEKPPPLYLHTL